VLNAALKLIEDVLEKNSEFGVDGFVPAALMATEDSSFQVNA